MTTQVRSTFHGANHPTLVSASSVFHICKRHLIQHRHILNHLTLFKHIKVHPVLDTVFNLTSPHIDRPPTPQKKE